MRIFLAGATGAVGKRLVPLLVAGGHHVIATMRTRDKIETLRAAGAHPVVVDGLDRDAVRKAVMSSSPDVIVHQMTALASMRSLRNFDDEFALTNRLRTDGTEYLLAAARAAGTHKFVAQSYTGWPNVREGGRIKTEDDPLDPHPPKAMTRSLEAIRKLENMVVNASDITGIVPRYGSFYGPGTSISQDGEIVEPESSRLSATVPESGRSSTSTTRPVQRGSRLSVVLREFKTSLTTIRQGKVGAGLAACVRELARRISPRSLAGAIPGQAPESGLSERWPQHKMLSCLELRLERFGRGEP